MASLRPATTRTSKSPAITLIGDEREEDRQEAETEQSDLVGYGEDPSILLHVMGG